MNKDILLEVMQYCRNHFIKERKAGMFVLNNNKLIMRGINTDIAQVGQYIIVTNTTKNKCLYKIVDVSTGVIELDEKVQNEQIFGVVFFLEIPPSFLLICKKIEAYEEARVSERAKNSNIASEHFGDYSVSYRTGTDGGAYGWQDEFRSNLTGYRRLMLDVEV